MSRPFRALIFKNRDTLGDAQGWNEVAPLALSDGCLVALFGRLFRRFAHSLFFGGRIPQKSANTRHERAEYFAITILCS